MVAVPLAAVIEPPVTSVVLPAKVTSPLAVTVALLLTVPPDTLTLLPTTGPAKFTVPLGMATDTLVAVPVVLPSSDLMVLTLATFMVPLPDALAPKLLVLMPERNAVVTPELDSTESPKVKVLPAGAATFKATELPVMVAEVALPSCVFQALKVMLTFCVEVLPITAGVAASIAAGAVTLGAALLATKETKLMLTPWS